MLIVRLQRVGRRNDPSFRVVVTEKKGPPRGQYLEKVGTYDVKRGNVAFDNERVLYWISQGAKPTPTVHNLLISSKVIEGKKIQNHKHAVPVKEAVVEADAPAAQEVVVETSKVEVTEDSTSSPQEESQVEEVIGEQAPAENEEVKEESAPEETEEAKEE